MGGKESSLDYFVGGVPAGIIFKMAHDRVCKLVSETPETEFGSNEVAEICFIALISYVEAFFKDQFASMVNLCPQLIENLCKAKCVIAIDASDLLVFRERPLQSLGFILSENYDFGTAQKINGLYHALLLIDPFSSDEKCEYDRLMNDRNLLVHHGGIFTLKYSKGSIIAEDDKGMPHWDSLKVSRASYLRGAQFLTSIVKKTVSASHKALTKFIQESGIAESKEHNEAVKLCGGYDL
jgi:hypothetical protein